MLHLLYILAFTILASLAVANLIRNLIMFSFDRDEFIQVNIHQPTIKAISLPENNLFPTQNY